MPIKKRTIQVPFESIIVDTGFNCRVEYTGIDELKQSIFEEGLLQNLGVALKTDPDSDENQHFLVYGFRRYFAIKKLREEHGSDFYATLDVVLNEGNFEDMRVKNLRENIDRCNLSTFEVAQQVRRMVQAGMDQREIGVRLGRNQSWVSYHYKVATKLSTDAQNALKTGAITLEQALHIADIPEDMQKELVDQVLDSDSRAEAKQLLKDATSETGKRRKYANKGRPSAKNMVQYVSDVSYEAESKVNTKDEKVFYNGVAAGLRIALGDIDAKELKAGSKYADINYHNRDNKKTEEEEPEESNGAAEKPAKRRPGRPRKQPQVTA